MATADLKKRMLRLLKEDEEFRYSVAGLIGLGEILKRLDSHEAELVRLREDMIAGFRRHDEELARLREDMNKLREDMIAGFRRHDEELARLREDMVAGFARVDRLVSALGSRWGLMAEDAFREGLRGLLEKEFGLRAERWSAVDEEGRVYGYRSVVEVDVAVKDGRVVLVEVASHVRRADVLAFRRKADFYEEFSGRKVDRLVMVSPFVDDDAFEMALAIGVEVYSKH